MRTWPSPPVPVLGTAGPPVRVHDTSTGSTVLTEPQGPARLYVCGITPYDATHLGHAATYVAFDLLNRAWRNAGHDVVYVQNVTDVDDPLLERAARDGVDWTALAERETELFRQDMTALRVLPPDHYVGVVEAIPLVVGQIERLVAAGATYRVDEDLYYSVAADETFGDVSSMLREEMLHLFPERGGDPDRPGKRDPLDALLWRAERPGEPAWDSPFGRGRPGWHIECSAIAMAHLGAGFDVQGGGSDLIFPHHEMSAAHTQAVGPGCAFARTYVHTGMVGYQGEKMSKSRGNLVFVSALRDAGVDPMAIRLTLLQHHYREDWEYRSQTLAEAAAQLGRWREALACGPVVGVAAYVAEVLAALADDLDAPRAVAAVQEWADATLTAPDSAPEADPAAEPPMRDVLDAALGLAL
ncbi:MAG TPA: cysteine--1-D-myo-inosityl 2-amino-2-deoxy-alpha-D-glucopyranoside ligase [Nocardioides sp.]|uniref:cysteine--1-D-myo-inosityl 2-amino-2-deoxy-alpha-D-glucopyranoside ligase n=1 Tax=Nocardioides sp. TaxID=35761 RepID=UPI002B50FEBB|nr:cysteine--1-D-myo-inosityl 2-amino-2-deoxy-alpha-D-glucopyranoside ligase [Nocardioides sp.]HQR26395.1 cysteine--1-D-myo-inosityl 2-amino-2-deoxy-alpha-D-glucopyranoside ligase [Nocardioides sp.]